MRTILLAGGPADREPGSPLGLPRPLWPMVMRPLVVRAIEGLVRGGTRALSVCANGRTDLYAARLTREPLRLDELCFVQDPLPRGPAGCLKDNEAFIQGETFVVANAACWIDDRVSTLVERHKQQHNQFTVFCVSQTCTPSGLYVCEPEVLDHIPPVGYCDIKEQLIPRLLDRGLRVGALPLHGGSVEVLNVKSYLSLHQRLLNTDLDGELRNCPGDYIQAGPQVWVSADARIDRNVRLFGPLIVGPGAKIMQGAVVIGPASVGPGAHIAEDAVITECVVWANARVPRGRCVDRTLIIPDEAMASGDRRHLVARVGQRIMTQLGSSSYV